MLKNLLAIETSAAICSVALLSNSSIYEQSQAAQREQSQLLLLMIDTLFKKAGIALNDLNAIALSIGPGSFTGVRLALSAVQGLTISNDIPVLPISSLQAIAQGIFENYGHTHVYVCVNAHMDEVFVGQFVAKNSVMQPQTAEVLISPEEVQSPGNTEWVGVGNGWQAYAERIPFHPQKIYHDYLPTAVNIVKLVQASESSLKLLSIDEVNAVYLRNASAWRRMSD